MYNRLTPDYGPTDNNGFVFGVDYMRLTKWWVNPGLEFRGKIANGGTVNESAYGGGVRVEKPFRSLRPYADFLISAGSIRYNFPGVPLLANGKPYTTDGTITYSFGGGMDVDVWRNFAVRGDYQYERWYLDKYHAIHLNPNGWSVGVVYRIPFHRYGR